MVEQRRSAAAAVGGGTSGSRPPDYSCESSQPHVAKYCRSELEVKIILWASCNIMQLLLTARLDLINDAENDLAVAKKLLLAPQFYQSAPPQMRGQKPWLSGEERSGGRSGDELANWRWPGML